MRDFEEKVVYITGGSSGIGLSTAKLMAASGAHVMIFARTKDRLEKALEDVRTQSRNDGQRASYLELDVSDHRQVDPVMEEAVRTFGVPDILVNCAGRARPRHFEEISHQQFDETIRVNLYGVWNTTKALVPHMKERGGHIVNVASLAGFMGVFGYTDYAASKFAVVGFSETLRSELKRYGIQVSVLCPPDTDTPGFQTENRTKPAETRAISETAKLLHPDDVARALLAGIKHDRFMILANMEGRLLYLLKRFAPFLLDWSMDRTIRRVQVGKR